MGTCRTEVADGRILLLLEGFWGIDQAMELRDRLRDALSLPGRLVLDLAAMTGGDLSFYQLVVAAGRSGDRLKIGPCSARIKDELGRHGLGAAFTESGLQQGETCLGRS
jgi:hypothetical protein